MENEKPEKMETSSVPIDNRKVSVTHSEVQLTSQLKIIPHLKRYCSLKLSEINDTFVECSQGNCWGDTSNCYDKFFWSSFEFIYQMGFFIAREFYCEQLK